MVQTNEKCVCVCGVHACACVYARVSNTIIAGSGQNIGPTGTECSPALAFIEGGGCYAVFPLVLQPWITEGHCKEASVVTDVTGGLQVQHKFLEFPASAKPGSFSSFLDILLLKLAF